MQVRYSTFKAEPNPLQILTALSSSFCQIRRRFGSEPILVPHYADNSATSGLSENLAGNDQSQGTPTVEPSWPIHLQLHALTCGEDITVRFTPPSRRRAFSCSSAQIWELD
jgi:hypothetical protein